MGSTNGKRWIKNELDKKAFTETGYPRPVLFAGSDSSLSEEDFKKYPELQMFPTVAG